jgi:hypothetical protein
MTSGFRRLQESKIRALGIERRFERIQVDAIDEPDRKGKGRLFAEILREYGFSPGEVLIVETRHRQDTPRTCLQCSYIRFTTANTNAVDQPTSKRPVSPSIPASTRQPGPRTMSPNPRVV